MSILETSRLSLSQLTDENASFILKLLNEPAFHEHIGDKGIRTIKEAEVYLNEGPIASYQTYGYGLYLTSLKENRQPIGVCGIKKRDSMDLPELGYAFLKKQWSNGYATEAARGVMDYACSELKLAKVAALTATENKGSIRVLEKVGFTFTRMISLPEFDAACKLFVKHC